MGHEKDATAIHDMNSAVSNPSNEDGVSDLPPQVSVIQAHYTARPSLAVVLVIHF